MSELLLFSGGLDSYIAWHYLEKPPTLFVKLDTICEPWEDKAVRSLVPKTQIIRVPWGQWEDTESWNLPLRNLLLVMVGAQLADRIWLVCQAEEQSIPDRTPKFFDMTTELISYLTEKDKEVLNVFPTWDKVQMVRWYLNQGLDPDDLVYKSISCFKPSHLGHCGQCGSCWRKYIALTYNGIGCLDIYSGDIRSWGEEHYKDRLSEYGVGRQKAMRKVMGW